MYIPRHIESVVTQASETFSVVMVTGARQVGKTTMLQKLAGEERRYVTLDSPLDRALAIEEPELFLQRHTPPVLIDEFQYAPELLTFIKMYVDRQGKAGDFWLTGSQSFHTMKGISESLSGRVAVIPMSSLSNREITGAAAKVFTGDQDDYVDRLADVQQQGVREVFEFIFKGSMPRLYQNVEVDHSLFYSSYVETYLQRDIRGLAQVADELSFLRFMTSCAVRTSQIVSYSELANDAGISQPTAKRWLSILVSSGIVQLVEPYFNNRLKRMVKAPRLYFMDTGLAAYLARWTSSETLEVSAVSGAFFETYVVSEIIKSYMNAGRRAPVFYYRDTDQKEIDLILDMNDVLLPYEIKKSAAPDRAAIRHFSVLAKTGKSIGPGGVICMCHTVSPIDECHSYIPVWVI